METPKQVPKASLLIFDTIMLVGAFIMLLGALFVLWRFFDRTILMNEPESVEPGFVLTADEALYLRAEDSIRSAERLSTFIETFSILIGLSIGAAAIYGLRSGHDLRKQIAEVEKLKDDLKPLKDMESTLEEYRISLETVLQAYQEFNQTRNHQEAYYFAEKILQKTPNSPLALYIAGWLGTHYIPNQLDDAVIKLEKATALLPEWTTVRATYGVALRRKAMQAPEHLRVGKLQDAIKVLDAALKANPNLLDPNSESFWGPVGGAFRDLGDGYLDEAIEAYKNATQVTPGSSYPVGNLATLHLRKGKQQGETKLTDENIRLALEEYKSTRDLATGRQVIYPADYFVLMDIAMASVILAYRLSDPMEAFEEAQAKVDSALSKEGESTERLGVSWRGWHYLKESCPVAWQPVHEQIDLALYKLNRKLVIASLFEQAEHEKLKFEKADPYLAEIFVFADQYPDVYRPNEIVQVWRDFAKDHQPNAAEEFADALEKVIEQVQHTAL